MVKRSPKKSETLEVRISYDAKQAFMEACAARGLSASEAVRAFVEAYPEKRSRLALNSLSKELNMLFTNLSLPLKISGAVAAAAVGSLALGAAPSAADSDKRAQFEKLDTNGDESVSL